MRYRAPIAVLSLILSATIAVAEPAHKVVSPRDPASGQSTGKVNLQDLHFTSRSDAVAKCPGGATVDQPDGGFACSSSSSPSSAEPAGMAINKNGTPGTKGPVKAQPK